MTTTPTATASAATAALESRWSVAAILSRLGPLLGLIVVFTLFAILQPAKFLTTNNFELMLVQTAVVGTAALGMTLIIITGGIDLSVGSTIALTTVTIAAVMSRFAGVNADGEPVESISLGPALAAAAAGVGIATLAGLFIGLIITQLRLLPFIVTLATWGAFRGAAKGAANEQTVQAPESALNSLLTALPEERQWMLLPPGLWLLLVLAVGTILLLRHTRFGRHLFAIGSNEQTARLCGVPVARTKTLAYALAGVFFGIAGVLQFSYLTVGDPTTANGMELDIIAAVVIGGASLSGGRGSIVGSLVGALIMTIVANGCTKCGLSNWVQAIVTGGIILLAVGVDRWRKQTS